jgi:predicted ester cyclase
MKFVDLRMKRFEEAASALSRAMPRRAAIRRLGAGGLAAGLFAGLRAGAVDAQSSLTSAATEAAARRAINAINQALSVGDMTVLDLAFAPDYVNHTPHRSPQSGQLFTADLAGLEASLVELRATVPDAVLLVDDVIASGDTAAVRATFRGTVDPAVLSLPAGTGGRLVIGGAAFARIVNGLVVESWDYNDAAEIVGAIPQVTPEPTVEPTPPPVEGGEAREIQDVQAVSLQGVGTLLIAQGDTESLTIEAEPKVLRRIETEVRGGTLTIRPARSFTTREAITYHLMVKQLSAIELSGAGVVEVPALSSEQLRLTLDQAGSLTIEQLTATTLEVASSGNGAITLAGSVDQQTVTLSGAAQYDASGLQSRAAAISADGAAQAVVNVTETLQASAGGAARIQYIGNPEVSEDVSAAGSVVNAG